MKTARLNKLENQHIRCGTKGNCKHFFDVAQLVYAQLKSLHSKNIETHASAFNQAWFQRQAWAGLNLNSQIHQENEHALGIVWLSCVSQAVKTSLREQLSKTFDLEQTKPIFCLKHVRHKRVPYETSNAACPAVSCHEHCSVTVIHIDGCVFYQPPSLWSCFRVEHHSSNWEMRTV